MSFRQAKVILREAAGSYANGLWVAGVRSNTTSDSSVQPVVMGRDMQALPEGRHQSDFVKLYTNDRLLVAADGEGIQPDIIIHDGYGYELISMEANRSGVISHYKFIGVKIFKFTTTAEWNAGTLKRP